jgi:glycosyltransferase A (GT-A) superfamily protein (DUF2064 family)
VTARLLVLAKAPVPGRVKTRLCPPCTPGQAAGIAAAALADTLDATAAAAAGTVLALDGRMAAPAGVAVREQRGGSLGERIAAAFAGLPGPVLQVGMDTPQVTPGLLDQCLAALDATVDAVLGPATDGGWWALGLHDPAHAGLIAGVPMSTPDTGRLTAAALRDAGLRVGTLPTLRDVDTWADAVAVAGLAPHGRFAAAVGAVAGTAGTAGSTGMAGAAG